jgi:rhodanese-related sulfurtransferase
LAEWLSASAPEKENHPAVPASQRRPLLLDVREPWEYAICRLPDSLSMPMRFLPERIGELDRRNNTVVICHHGIRSLRVAHFLERQGFAAVHNLSGGIDAWANDVDPLMRKY